MRLMDFSCNWVLSFLLFPVFLQLADIRELNGGNNPIFYGLYIEYRV